MRLPKFRYTPLAERNRITVGAVGILLLLGLVIATFSYDRLPFIKGTNDFTAYFSEAGGIKPGSDVRVSGMSVGRVSEINLEGTQVRVDFTVRRGVELGDRTEAAIKTETVLGTKMLELTSRGEGTLSGPIPLQRTTSPYDLPSALGDLTATISGLDTVKLSESLTTLSQTFADTPPALEAALEGVSRFSDTLNTRDAKLRELLDYNGIYLDFNLNLNLPPPCNAGFLPVQQQRSPAAVDAPDRPAGELYCRVPQDSSLNVRGVRNIPCETNPAKRAPTVEMCESDEQYVPLNDGWNWKGDPNATVSGQDVPQYPKGRPYGPATDSGAQSWEDMLTPPGG